jgi:hypothetical protein
MGEKPAVMDMLNRLKQVDNRYFDNWIAIDGQLVGNQNSDQYTWRHNWFFYGNSLRMDCLDWSDGGQPDFRTVQFCQALASDLTQNNAECGQMQIIGPMRFICKRNVGTSG